MDGSPARAPFLGDETVQSASPKPSGTQLPPTTTSVPKKLTRAQRMMLLGGAYLVLFTRYTIATFLSSFFPQLAADRFQITDTYNGLIFAAYPLGMSITSIFAPQAIACMGTRTATGLGLAATTLLTVLFGVAPDLCGMPNLQYVFLVSYFLSGLLGALAETACIILVSATFKANPAAVMASINTVCTVGCMLGPPVGGVIFELGRKIDEGWAFLPPHTSLGDTWHAPSSPHLPW